MTIKKVLLSVGAPFSFVLGAIYILSQEIAAGDSVKILFDIDLTQSDIQGIGIIAKTNGFTIEAHTDEKPNYIILTKKIPNTSKTDSEQKES